MVQLRGWLLFRLYSSRFYAAINTIHTPYVASGLVALCLHLRIYSNKTSRRVLTCVCLQLLSQPRQCVLSLRTVRKIVSNCRFAVLNRRLQPIWPASFDCNMLQEVVSFAAVVVSAGMKKAALTSVQLVYSFYICRYLCVCSVGKFMDFNCINLMANIRQNNNS